jgi:hypothetical protein
MYHRAMANRFAAVVVSMVACGGGGGGGGGKKEARPSVTCKIGSGPSVECEATQSDPDAKYKVCWTFTATCKNGETFVAENLCASVNGSIVTQARFTEDRYFKISGECDQKLSEKVSNVTIEKMKDE